MRLQDAALVAGQGEGGELNLEGDGLTLLARFKNEGPGWGVTFVGKHGGHDHLQYNIYGFPLGDTGGLDLGVEIGTDAGLQRATAVVGVDRLRANGGWHDVFARYDGETVDLFFDGRLRMSEPASGSLRPSGPAPMVIGGEPGDDGAVGRRFTGLIDHVAVWDRALSDAEVARLSGATAEEAATEHWRGVLRFTAPANRMNDPNGLVYAGGEYHLLSQHNPHADRWGHMSWGHATSPDLLSWTHRGVAIPEIAPVWAFSGSSVLDERHTSGLGEGGAGPLVALYTGHDYERNRQSQRLAWSGDGGATWEIYRDNPVIAEELEHFRDPKVFWHGPSGAWVMAVARAVERVVEFYGSDDPLSWRKLSEFGPAGATGVPNWECPELMDLPVIGPDGEPTGATRWVLQIDVGGGAVAGGSGAQYFLGEFDGERFVSDDGPGVVRWVDRGADFYAAQAWNGAEREDGRSLWLAWMNNWSYAELTPTWSWRSAMSFPREVFLVETAGGLRLAQRPAPEIERLHEPGSAVVVAGRAIEPGDDPFDGLGVGGETLDLELVLRPEGGGTCGVIVRESPGGTEGTVIGYDAVSRELVVDRRRSGVVDFHPPFAAVHRAPLEPSADGSVAVRVLVDRSGVEVFGGRGEAVITDQIFRSPGSVGVSLFAEGGGAVVERAAVRRLAAPGG